MRKFIKKLDLILLKIENQIIKGIKYIFSFRGKNRRSKHFVKKCVLIICALMFTGFGAGLLWFSSIEIPDLASFDQRMLGQSTKIFDRTGKIMLYDLSKNMRRTVVPFDQISQNVKNATIAIEDSEFYNHKGIRITSIIRALFADISSGNFSQGGSTITQQVVKNSLLTREKTITRKIKEIFLAIKLERNLKKDEILNLYLNESPYGGTIYGIEEASVVYFGKSVSELNFAESAYLASIPQSPTKYSPFGKHRADLDKRKNLTLLKMKEQGYITEDEYNSSKEEKVVFALEKSGGIKAPHFVMFIKDYLEDEYGDKLLAEGGLKVTTTLDYEMQLKAEEIVKRKAIENGKLYHATNAALVAIDSKSGQILTMVGSRDYFDVEVDGNYNVATAKRQPGSSFKPIIYAKAFEMGYRPETILFDTETQFTTSCPANDTTSTDPCYSPGNYDGKFRGPISLRNALAQSINIPAVKLLYLVGVNNAIDFAEKLGISTLGDRERFGLSLVLGGGEVTLLDMTSAYSVFSDYGIKHKTTGILKIEDKFGETLEEYKENGVKVMDENAVHLLSDVLSDNIARTPIFGPTSSLYFKDRQVAAKTGTTNNYRDAWVVGYTPQITVGAWSGNNDNSPIDRQVAGYIVAPMWHEFMTEILKEIPDERFIKPAESDLSSLKPVLRGVAGQHTILYYINKANPLGPAPTNPLSDPQTAHWEYGVQKYLGGQGLPNETTAPTTNTSAPTNTGSNLKINITSPRDNQSFSNGDKINVRVQARSDTSIKRVDYYLENSFVGSSEFYPYTGTFVMDSSKGKPGANTIRAVVTDINNNQTSSSVFINKI
jgi:1A family penicillin-binding protein